MLPFCSTQKYYRACFIIVQVLTVYYTVLVQHYILVSVLQLQFFHYFLVDPTHVFLTGDFLSFRTAGEPFCPVNTYSTQVKYSCFYYHDELNVTVKKKIMEEDHELG